MSSVIVAFADDVNAEQARKIVESCNCSWETTNYMESIQCANIEVPPGQEQTFIDLFLANKGVLTANLNKIHTISNLLEENA